MNIRTINADQLTPSLLAAWAEIQQNEPSLASPYFRPEFTQAVAAVRNDVEVAILEESGTAVGFFPFQRSSKNAALPVGGRMSDFHGVVVRRETAWDVRHLLEACRLSAWRFDHLVADQEAFRPYHWDVATSPYLDLSAGWAGYESAQRVSHRDSFKELLRKHRRASREAGPLRVEMDSTDPAAFRALLEWKVAQYRATGVVNVLAFDWTVALLERVLAARTEAFSGMISTLTMNDTLSAAVLSIRSYGVLHGWFSAYCPSLASMSPGLVLWLEIAQRCPEMGVRRIDLGKGPERYKRELMSDAVELAEGSVDLRPAAALVGRGWHRAYQWMRSSSLRGPLLGPGRFVRRITDARSFR